MTRVLALLSIFLALPVLVACPARPPVVGCTENATQCGPNGPQVCSVEGRWYDTASDPCPAEAPCCLVRHAGGEVHACAPPSACVEPTPGSGYAPPAAPEETGSSSGAGGAP